MAVGDFSVIIFAGYTFGGLHTHIFVDTPDLTQLELYGVAGGPQTAGNWNDNISSFVILGNGTWQFYQDINYTTPVGQAFGPGQYHDVRVFGIGDNSISSIKFLG